MLRFVQNDTVLFCTPWLEIWGINFLNAKIFLSSLFFKEAKLAKFIRYEAVWKVMWDNVMMWWCDDAVMWWMWWMWWMKDEGCEI